MAKITTRYFQSAKEGNRADECEDALRVAVGSDGPVRFALCDGASESAFARRWAKVLTKSFIQRPLDPCDLDEASLKQWLEPCAEQWSRGIPWNRLPWHGVAKTHAGAWAALLGMTVEWPQDDGGVFSWRAVAVGDCCLFVVRDDELVVAFPMDDSSQFNNTPALICSNRANNPGLWSHVKPLHGECRQRDVIILASDAVASWILQGRESGGKPWRELLELGTEAAWNYWLETQRRQRAIRNDDATLITVRIE